MDGERKKERHTPKEMNDREAKRRLNFTCLYRFDLTGQVL